MRESSPEPCVPLVLPARARRRGAGPLDFLEEPARPFPRQRSAARVFKTTVRRCLAEGLVGGEGVAVDASMIKADANRQHSAPGSEWVAPETARHAVRNASHMTRSRLTVVLTQFGQRRKPWRTKPRGTASRRRSVISLPVSVAGLGATLRQLQLIEDRAQSLDARRS